MTKSIKKGFTLIEMLIVIVIIGILAGVLIPKIGGAREKANDVAVKANVRSYAQGILQIQLANGDMPGSFDELNTSTGAQTYNYNYVSDATGYYYKNDTNKFIICGTVSTGGNADDDTITEGNFTENFDIDDWVEKTEGSFYCYKG